jgi:tRNA threonylcarbamoyladenosine biosynthesis protein TsaE
MDRLVYQASDERATAALGTALAEALPDGSVVALCGTLGAGKTQLVQAVAEACGVDRRQVTSPTFVLAQEYHARRTIYHLDAYRLATPEEFLELGPEEYFESEGLVLIEWADRVVEFIPPDRLDIRIEVTGDTSRRFELIASGPRHAAAIPRVASLLKDLGALPAT